MKLTRRLTALVAVTALAPAAGAAHAATLPAGSTALLSGGPSLFEALPIPVTSNRISPEAVSRDGRYVAFTSRSDGLFDGDDDRVENVYVKDRQTGAVLLASRRTGLAGEPSHADCDDAVISDDGTRVAFACEGALDPADTNPQEDIYVRDIATSTTFLVSRAGNLGPVGDSRSLYPTISATGAYVAFVTEAHNITPDLTSGSAVVRRQIGGTNGVVLVSRENGAAGTVANSNEPSISDDGNRVAFVNYVSLDAGDTNTNPDVYLRDIAAATTVYISRAPGANGAAGNGDSTRPALAGDGGAVAFESESNNFDFTADSDKEPDIYWRSLSSNNTALVSINAAGTKGHTSTEPSISNDGAAVGFVSRGALDPADTSTVEDAYVKNVMTNVLHLVSRADGPTGAAANAGVGGVSVSGDGTKAAATVFGAVVAGDDPRRGAVVLRDFAAQRTFSVSRPAGDAPFRNQGGFANNASLSADGRFAAFISDAAGLGVPDDVREAVLVRDRVTGDVVLASRADGAGGDPIKDRLSSAVISADGRRVAFATSNESTQRRDILVRDLPSGRTFLASRADGAAGAPANAAVFDPKLDADGSRVAFSTTATNLGDGDTDALSDIHVRDLAADRTILVSRADGPAGAKGNGASNGADINADGTRVSFASAATNLGDGDTDTQFDVHLRDLSAGTTRLVSATPAGVKSNASSNQGSIDGAGTRVAFVSPATNLVGTSTLYKVFVRDLAAGTLVLASRADGADGAPADDHSGGSVISPDGGFVAFQSEAGNLAPGAGADVLRVYRRDLAGERTALVSKRSDGTPTALRSDVGDISDLGACVSFVTTEGIVGPTVDSNQAYVHAFRADCAPADPVADQGGGGADAGAGGGGAQGGSSATGRDTVAPVLSGAKLNRKRFRVGRAATALAAAVRRGAALSFRSSEAGTLSITVERRAVKKAKKRGRKARVTYRRAGALTRKVKAGAGRVALTGRVGTKRLAAGRYRLVLTARDAAGNRSRAVQVTFTIVKG